MPFTADQYTNNATSSIAGGTSGRGTALQASDTTLYLPTSDGAKFPTISGGQTFRLQLGTSEIVIVTARATDTLTITRGAEGTTAQTWQVGTTAQLVVTAAELVNLWTAINQGRYFNVKDYGAKGDNSNDDTSAINAAIAAAVSAGGGTVYLPIGIYKTTGAISIGGNNVLLLGAGIGAGNTNGSPIGATIIRPAAGATYDAITTPLPPTPGTAGYVLYGVSLMNLVIDCAQMTGNVTGKGNGVHFYGVRYGNVYNVQVYSSPNWAFLIEGDSTNYAYNSSFYDCIVGGCAAGFRFTSSEQCCLHRCVIQGANATCTAAQPYSSGSPTTYSAMLLADTGWIMATNCTFGTSGTYTGECIKCTNSNSCAIIGCLFDGINGTAIYLPAGGHIFANNVLQNPNSTTAGPIIKLASSGNIVTGNIVQGTGSWTYCVQESGGPYTGNIIADNHFVAGSSGTISLNATSTARVHDNIGYNPVGQVTAPAFPATTVGVTNNTGVSAMAYIANGTGAITVVQIAGQNGTYNTTGLQIAASGFASVRIPSGGSVKFTYASGTPTWTWFGD